MKLSLLSNINIDLIIDGLSKKYEVYKPAGYGSWVQEILSSKLSEFNSEIIFILLDGNELISENYSVPEIQSQIDTYFTYINEFLNCNNNINIFISNIDLPLTKIQSIKEVRKERIIENYWYKKLCNLCDKFSNVYIFDLKQFIEEVGRKDFYSEKLWYLGSIRYTLKAQKLIKNEITRYVESFKGVKRKCLILDLDNTLWGGIIGEDGIEGIELSEFKEGARYRDFQKRIKEIKKTGVILAIVSKNNYEDVLNVFENHPHMYLKLDDFVEMKINWKSKVDNIIEISKELNIGLESFVFIDDNPVERESVKAMIPQVVVPDFPKDTSMLSNFITEIYYDYFLSLNTTNEDKKKSEIYKQNVERKKSRQNSVSLEGFLKNLRTQICIWEAKNEDVERIAQLTQKTNQFNLTTKRYTTTDIYSFLKSKDYKVYVTSIKDKFGDNGKVCVAIIRKKNNICAEIDTFLMSCRVMERYIEDEIIDFIENKLKSEGYKQIIAYYYQTSKNKPAKMLFERLGYTVMQQDKQGNKKYILKLDSEKVPRKKFGEMVKI